MTWQAQDRCHRIGQTREVHIYRLVSEKTIEENILTKSDQKRQLDHLAIQSGGFNTEFLQKFNPRELLGVQTGGSPPATPPPYNSSGSPVLRLRQCSTHRYSLIILSSGQMWHLCCLGCQYHIACIGLDVNKIGLECSKMRKFW